MIRHTIKLLGPEAHGPRVSIHVLRALSDALIEAAQRSLRLHVEGRSHLQGKASWLDEATDFQLVGLREGSTVLEWEAPTLGEAVPQIFEQLSLWDVKPERHESALSLVEEVIREATAGNADSDLLDRSILDAVCSFRHVIDLGFDGLVMNGGTGASQPVTLSPEGLRTVDRLREEAPPSERVIVSGYLDQLTGSKRAFNLLMPSGQALRGILPAGDPSSYASLFTRKVVVDGEARFRPSGALSLIVASHIQEATETDAIWGQVPHPRPRSLSDLRPRTPSAPGTNALAEIIGQWPGDETDEEIQAVLDEMS